MISQNLSLRSWTRRAVVVIAVASATACSHTGVVGEAPKQASSRPNVLVILADDLGYSDIGAFGGEIPTPNLDRLASQGRLLTNHYVAPTCSPTRAMLMSGTDNHLAGLGTMEEALRGAPQLRGKPGYEGFLNDKVTLMPEALRRAGYHTYMAGKWHLGKEPDAYPAARGFESSFALLAGGGNHFGPVPGKPIIADRPTWVENTEKVTLPTGFYSSTAITDKLIGYIERNRADGKPFFAYAAYTAPHWPLHAPDEDIAKFKGKYDAGYEQIREARLARQKALGLLGPNVKPYSGIPPSKDFPSWDLLSPEDRAEEARKMEVYAAMVHNMDRNIGRLIDYLVKTGAYDNTLVVFQSDNGAEPSQSFIPNNANNDNRLENIGRPLSNVGYGARWAEVSAAPFRLFKGWTADGGIIAPAIVRMPAQTQALPPVTVPTHITDVAPTILDVAGVKATATAADGRPLLPMTGDSLTALLREPTAPRRFVERPVEGELFGGRFVRKGPWKLVSVLPPFGDNTWELYDVQKDRYENQNVAAQHPDVIKRLAEDWDSYAKRVGLIYTVESRMPDVRFKAPPNRGGGL
ncbi:arylsulfatase [Azohydromonas australica]|uniref:arylsulfatase n=1 Tax=Azohydromonas australica TaxID=364039 RepID=UPI00040733A6|nr:arylsulfatase [Azohydromonas australica]